MKYYSSFDFSPTIKKYNHGLLVGCTKTSCIYPLAYSLPIADLEQTSHLFIVFNDTDIFEKSRPLVMLNVKIRLVGLFLRY